MARRRLAIACPGLTRHRPQRRLAIATWSGPNDPDKDLGEREGSGSKVEGGRVVW